MWMVFSLVFGVVVPPSLCPSAFLSYSVRDLGGRRLGRPALMAGPCTSGAGKCRLGTGLGRMQKAVKPAAAIAHSGWMQLGIAIDFTHVVLLASLARAVKTISSQSISLTQNK